MTHHDMTREREAAGLPATPAACRERLVTLQDEIASIRTQIATTDIRRQTAKRAPDPVGFHRAKTALRLKQQELARVKAHLATLQDTTPDSRRAGLQAALIAVIRAECDDTVWAEWMHRAKQLQAEQGGFHG